MYEDITPDMLAGTFEATFPLIYPGDIVSRKRTATVKQIDHHVRSTFNRIYLCVTTTEGHKVDLYTVNLVERSDKTRKLFRSGPVFVDDRIEITDPTHLRYGKIGRVVGISEGKTGLLYRVRDEEALKNYLATVNRRNRAMEEEAQRRLNGEKAMTDFELEKMLQPEFYKSIVPEEEIKAAFETPIKRQATAEIRHSFRRENYLPEQIFFYVPAGSARLVEQFPPNGLFNLVVQP